MSVATSYGDINQRTAVFAAGTMLEYAEPWLVLDKFVSLKPLPKNTADTVKFRRPIPFTVSLTQLQEGVTPPAKQFQYEDVQVQMGQYGDLVSISDRIADLAEDPVLMDAAEACGNQAAETKERILWGAMVGGTNAYYSGTGTPTSRGDVNDVLTRAIVRKVTRSLKSQRGKKIAKMVSASPAYNTEAVQPSYLAFCHTDVEQDIQDITGFTNIKDYGQFQPLSDHEIGAVDQVRFQATPVLVPWEASGSGTLNGMVSSDSTNVDVYPVVFMAQNAVGSVPLKGANAIKPYVKNPGTPSDSDPLGQRGFVSWKMYFAALILNDAWLIRAEVGVTDL